MRADRSWDQVHLRLGDWDTAVETAHRCIAVDKDSIDARRLLVLHQLCRVGSAAAATEYLGGVIAAIDAREPKNHLLYYQASLVAARLSGRNPLILQQAATLLDRALALNKTTAEYITERAYQQVCRAPHGRNGLS